MVVLESKDTPAGILDPYWRNCRLSAEDPDITQSVASRWILQNSLTLWILIQYLRGLKPIQNSYWIAIFELRVCQLEGQMCECGSALITIESSVWNVADHQSIY
jgi:hypothetical protein